MTFSKRHLSFKFELGEGSFGEDGSNTFEISGIRAKVNIDKAGGVSMTNLSAQIWGMPLSVMNKLTIIGKPRMSARRNTVTVLAGSDNSGSAVVFTGTINEAWVDGRNAPQVAFIVQAFSGLVTAMKPVQPVSYKGTVDAALVMSGIAQQAGYAFENSGVSVQISDQYLPGTALQQIQKVAHLGHFNYIIDDGTLAIWPKDGARGGEQILLSPDTGLIGYPMRTETGIEVATEFNPSIVFGGRVEVKSSLTPTNGAWKVIQVAHALEAEVPGGDWRTTVGCSLLGSDTGVGK